MAVQIDGSISGIYEKFPQEIRDKIDQRKLVIQPRPEVITEEDGKWIKEHIDDLFKKGGRGDEIICLIILNRHIILKTAIVCKYIAKDAKVSAKLRKVIF